MSVRLHAPDSGTLESSADHDVLSLYTEFRPEIVPIPGYGKIRIGLVEATVSLDLFGMSTNEIMFPALKDLLDGGPISQVTEKRAQAPSKVTAKLDLNAAVEAGVSGGSVPPVELSLVGPSRDGYEVTYSEHLIHTEVSRKVSLSGEAVELSFVTRRRGINSPDAYLTGACEIPFATRRTDTQCKVSVFSSKISNQAFLIVDDHLSSKTPGRLNPFRVIFKKAVQKKLSELGPLTHIEWEIAHA